MDSALVVGSEIVLALYPLLIKLVDTNLPTQLLARFLTFGGLAAVLASPSSLQAAWGSLPAAATSIALGTLTLSHVTMSYYAFDRLPAGPAMSLFYTYPLWTIAAGVAFFGESVSPYHAVLIAVALAGVALVAYGTEQVDPEEKTKTVRWDGVAAALAAALTETAMYFAVKTAKQKNPYFSILQLYPGALVGLALYLVVSKAPVDLKPSSWSQMILFNALVGFVGYAFRFYAVPKVDTVVFSLLTFSGVAASFFWGWLFANEVPTMKSALGAALITVASTLAS